MTTVIEINNLKIQREDDFILHVPQLSIAKGETFAVIGPNGSGKSTLLLVIASLLKPTSGTICFEGTPLASLNIKNYRRRLGLVFQEPLLLNSSVTENIATGLRFRNVPRSEITAKSTAWMERLHIHHLAKRSARKLSGGEAHRTSLARAFVLDPELMLLDEPFGALDAPTRAVLLEDLQSLLRTTGTTTIFVTHDLDEALLLADRVAVLINGKVRQVGTPQDVFSTPVDAEVAAFVGVETIVPGIVTGKNKGLVTIKSNGFLLEAVGQSTIGRNVYLCLRPEDVTLWNTEEPLKGSARNRLSGTIERMVPQGALMRVVLDCGFPLVSLITRASAENMKLKPGKTVLASFKATAVHLILR
jgi:molybdopterin-binding protein